MQVDELPFPIQTVELQEKENSRWQGEDHIEDFNT
jgi:hypothetical protein